MHVRFTLPIIAVVAVVAWMLHAGHLSIPDRWNPFAPLAVADPPNGLTRFKLSRLSSDAAACRAVLAASQLRVRPEPDGTAASGCEIRNAFRIDATSASVVPFVLTCESAVALALWDRHVLQPLALAHFGQPVARVDHYGSYACRNLYGRKDAPRSRHATADALDIAGFTLADGSRIRVLADWPGDGAKAAFLRDVHRGACRFFDAALGPDYNAAHRDHLHFDRGSYRVCR